MSDELNGYLRTAIRLIEGYKPECETRVSLDMAVDQIRGVIQRIEAARTPDPEACAAYDARQQAPHEMGTWPAYRDGYAAGLAAARADAERLRAAIRAVRSATRLNRFEAYQELDRALDATPATGWGEAKPGPSPETLTPFEAWVVKGLADGLTPSELGRRCGLNDRRIARVAMLADAKLAATGQGAARPAQIAPIEDPGDPALHS